MEMKFCKYCNAEHPLTTEFWKFRRSSTTTICRARDREYQRKYAAKEQVKKARAAWAKAHPSTWEKDNPERHRVARKRWEKDNHDHLRQYKNAYHRSRKSDPTYKIAINVRNRISKTLKRMKCGQVRGKLALLGCSLDFLKTYLEARFQPGMSWENHGYRGWHIDHVRPLSLFDLSDPSQLAEACHYTNLQPLWARDNLKKGAKYDRDVTPSFAP